MNGANIFVMLNRSEGNLRAFLSSIMHVLLRMGLFYNFIKNVCIFTRLIEIKYWTLSSFYLNQSSEFCDYLPGLVSERGRALRTREDLAAKCGR